MLALLFSTVALCYTQLFGRGLFHYPFAFFDSRVFFLLKEKKNLLKGLHFLSSSILLAMAGCFCRGERKRRKKGKLNGMAAILVNLIIT